MKPKSNSQLKLELTGRTSNESLVLLRGKCIGRAYKRGIGYVVIWSDGEESHFDSIAHFEEMAPILALANGYS